MPSAANYGAKVGQAIRGNLGRGTGGRFARSGSGTGGGAAQPTTVTTADLTAAAGMSAGELEALRNLASGKPLSESQVASLEAAGLAQRNSDGQLVRTSAARSFMNALKKGDVQAMKEALSNGREKAAKKAAKGTKSPKASKPSAAERQAQRQQAQNDALAQALEAIGNDDADLQAEFVSFARGEGELSEGVATSLEKQGLVEVNDDGTYRLTDQGRSFVKSGLRGDKRGATDAAKRAAEIYAKKAAKAERDLETKEAGWKSWRWVIRSGSNFKDVRGEHISQMSLETAEGMGEGPLLWWHEYDDEEDGQGLPVTLGWADFGAMHNGCVIESGSFVCKEAAEFVDANADRLAASLGFWNAKEDYDHGVYRGPIAIAERSLMETGLQANGLADLVIVIKGAEDMKAHKKSALVRMAGAANVEAILANTDERVKAAQHIGLTQMEAGAEGAPQTTVGDDPGAYAPASVGTATVTPITSGTTSTPITSSSEASGEVETPAAEATAVVATTDGQQGAVDVKAAATEAPAADEPAKEQWFVGDMTPAEFTQLLGASMAKSLSDALAAVVPQLASAQLTTKAADDIVALTKKVDDLTKRLEDDTPREGFRPAGDPDSIVKKQAGVDFRGPQIDPEMANALDLVASLSGRTGQQA